MPPQMVWVTGEQSKELTKLKNDLDNALSAGAGYRRKLDHILLILLWEESENGNLEQLSQKIGQHREAFGNHLRRFPSNNFVVVELWKHIVFRGNLAIFVARAASSADGL